MSNEPNATPAGLTVRDIITLYLRHSEASGVHGPEALADRLRTFGLFVETCGNLRVTDAKPYHLTDFIEAHPTWRSVSTRRAKANYIRAAFQWAAEQERIDRNPFVRVRYAEAESRPPMPDATLEQFASLGNKSFERAIRFLRFAGCRLSELCVAEWPDMDMERALWTIRKHKSRRFTRKVKIVPLVPEAVNLLKEVRRTQRSDYLGFIFLNNRDKPWTRRTLGQQLSRMKKKFGIDSPATLHGIRHQFATSCIVNGAPLKLVSEALGHSSSAITEKYYAHMAQATDAIRRASQLGLPKVDSD